LLTGMTGISLHMQWPLTFQLHGRVTQREQFFLLRIKLYAQKTIVTTCKNNQSFLSQSMPIRNVSKSCAVLHKQMSEESFNKDVSKFVIRLAKCNGANCLYVYSTYTIYFIII
jgi:phosphorylcholine metabolism protein LicD